MLSKAYILVPTLCKSFVHLNNIYYILHIYEKSTKNAAADAKVVEKILITHYHIALFSKHI